MTKQSKFAYLAGFIDGEGCFSITHNRNGSPKGFGYTARICIVSTNRGILEWIVQNFGGSILNRNPKNWKSNWKKSYEWRFTSIKPMESLLLGLLPYLIVKKEQANTLLKYARLQGQNNPSAREELFLQMKKLNFRGVELESVTTNTSSTSLDVKRESELTGDSKSDPVVTQDS
jgi:hypothetical protein